MHPSTHTATAQPDPSPFSILDLSLSHPLYFGLHARPPAALLGLRAFGSGVPCRLVCRFRRAYDSHIARLLTSVALKYASGGVGRWH